MKVDKWFSQGAAAYATDLTLFAGAREVKLEYFESGGSGVALLSWTLVTGLSCLPDVQLMGSAPRTGEGEGVATTAISQAPKRCGLKQSD
jgi:hypothetical protein